MRYKVLRIIEIVFFSLEIIALVLLLISLYNNSIRDKYDGLGLGIVTLLFLPSFVSECFIFSFIRCLFSIKKTIEIVVSIIGIVVSSFGFLCLIGKLFFKGTGDSFWLISWMLILVAIICRIIVLACRKKANNN